MVTQYYSILGVRQYASKDEVKKAFRSKIKTLHPDVSQNPNSQQEFLQVQQAYEVLMKYSLEEIIIIELLQNKQQKQQPPPQANPPRPKKPKQRDANFEKFTLKQDTRLKYIKTLFIVMLSVTILCSPLTFFIDEQALNKYVFFLNYGTFFMFGILYTKGIRDKYNPNKHY